MPTATITESSTNSLLGAGISSPATAEVTNWIFQGIPCRQRMFCLNGGTCMFFPRLNVQACNCSSGFEGTRCERIATAVEYGYNYGRMDHPGDGFAPDEVNGLGLTGFRTFMIFSNIAIIILLCILLVLFARIRCRINKQSRRMGGACRRMSVINGEHRVWMPVEEPVRYHKSIWSRTFSWLNVEPAHAQEYYASIPRSSVDSAYVDSDCIGSLRHTQNNSSKWTIVKEKVFCNTLSHPTEERSRATVAE